MNAVFHGHQQCAHRWGLGGHGTSRNLLSHLRETVDGIALIYLYKVDERGELTVEIALKGGLTEPVEDPLSFGLRSRNCWSRDRSKQVGRCMRGDRRFAVVVLFREVEAVRIPGAYTVALDGESQG